MTGMAHIVTEIVKFDNKRNKVTLDYGEVTFLLYKGECRRLGIRYSAGSFGEEHEAEKTSDGVRAHIITSGRAGTAAAEAAATTTAADTTVISDDIYRSIMEDILLPRAKKRVMYYLKNADKTRDQIRRKLREGYYPESIIDATFSFLDRYGFADDSRYAENYVEELKGTRSRREISQKLAQRGISRETAAEILSELSGEEEYAACEKALRKKYAHGLQREDRQKAYAYLARRGFSFDAIEHAVRAAEADTDTD